MSASAGSADAASVSVLRIDRHDDPATVVLHGELDITTLPQAERAVEAAEEAAPPVLVLDLSELEYVDSSGVRLVLLADGRARADGRRLPVRLGGGLARRVFDLLGLLDRLELVDESSDAAPPQ